MIHGFVKLAAAVPEISVASPLRNVSSITALIDRAYDEKCAVVVFPELCVTSYSCGDLFFTDTLLHDAEKAVGEIVAYTEGKKMLVFVGCPIVANGKLYNCAAAISNGALLGLVPKSNIPNYAEFYEARHFTSASKIDHCCSVPFCGSYVPFGTEMLFACDEVKELVVGCEICEDMWVSAPPSIRHTAAGATVIVNLSASNEVIGKDRYRRAMVESTSGRQVCAYVYADAGETESTTDIVFSGHCMIAANGTIAAENPPFGGAELTVGIVDLKHLTHDRLRMNTYEQKDTGDHLVMPFSLDVTETDISHENTKLIVPRPFIPGGEGDKKSVCGRILDIQSRGLAKRIRAAHAAGCVIALSGGLDSTLALIVTVRAMDLCGKPRSAITSVTMPCFGTTSRTRSNAEELALEFGTSFRCIDIKEAVDIHFRDIGHDANDLTVVYENAQARERTQIIMDIANRDGSLVIGTGDLSELALGWATYNGDHMSNYGVNGGVPKTLVRHVVSYYADECEASGKTRLCEVLRDVLATPVSPELLPAKDGEISQRTEDIVGPYELHDFFLYHFMRWGETPDKIFREAKAAFAGDFDDATIEKWLKTFMRRFFIQQFKRSALPDGPKVGSVALSPRGDWRMPSDAVPWDVL